MRIAVLGAGAFGSALGGILEKNGHLVQYFDKEKFPNVELAGVLDFAEVVLLAVPSMAVVELVAQIPEEKTVILSTKGLVSLDIFKKFKNFGVMSGATFARDLADGKPTRMTATQPLIESLFANAAIKFDRTDDDLGVMLCGSLKNVYAVGAGYRGIRYGMPEFAEYIRAAASEMRDFLREKQARPETVDLACGVADLILTCNSSDSRNYQFGQALKRGGLVTGTIEAQNTAQMLHAVRQPLLGSIIQLIG